MINPEYKEGLGKIFLRGFSNWEKLLHRIIGVWNLSWLLFSGGGSGLCGGSDPDYFPPTDFRLYGHFQLWWRDGIFRPGSNTKEPE
jgi:hypothetical protein